MDAQMRLRKNAGCRTVTTLGLSALTFAGAKASYGLLRKPVAPVWLTTDLVPKMLLVVRFADDLTVASGHYLVRMPDGLSDFQRQMDGMRSMLSQYDAAVTSLRERKDFYRDELEQLRSVDPELSYLASEALGFMLAELNDMELPKWDKESLIADRHTKLRARSVPSVDPLGARKVGASTGTCKHLRISAQLKDATRCEAAKNGSDVSPAPATMRVTVHVGS